MSASTSSPTEFADQPTAPGVPAFAYDLRSDTVTRPTPAMRAAMLAADVGDDVYGEDPSVNSLEAQIAALLGKPAALFVSSGTQSNLVALLSHCARGDEYIAGVNAHAYRYEAGGAAVLGGIQPAPLPFAEDGTLPLVSIARMIKPDDVHFARTRLICLENTTGGQPLELAYMMEFAQFCQERGLATHLDGARLFNAAIAKDLAPAAIADCFDSVSVCFSKGLGAPMGSALVGNAALINAARRWRKMLGGGLRQAGFAAAAAAYALEHHIERLADDHARAQRLAKLLAEHQLLRDSIRCATNMVFVDLSPQHRSRLAGALAEHGVNAGDSGRLVLHLDIDDGLFERVADALKLL